MRSSSLLLSLGLSIVAIAAGFASSVRRPPAISRGVPDPVPQDHHTLARGIAPSNASLADANCFDFVVVVATLGRRPISPPLVVEQSPPPTDVLLCVPPCARICLCPFVEGGAPPPPLLYSERCTMPLAGWEGRCGHVCGRWILLGGDRCVERRRAAHPYSLPPLEALSPLPSPLVFVGVSPWHRAIDGTRGTSPRQLVRLLARCFGGGWAGDVDP